MVNQLKYVGLVVISIVMVLETIGIYMEFHHCNANNSNLLRFTLSVSDSASACDICSSDESAQSCCQANSQSASKEDKCCHTKDVYLKVTEDFLVSSFLVSPEPLQIQIFNCQINTLEIAELAPGIEKTTIYPPPHPLWGHNLLKVYCSFKIGNCC